MIRDHAWFDLQWKTAKVSVRRVVIEWAPNGEADDCFAETMTRAWTSRESFTEGKPFAAWACRIAQRICMDARRRRTACCRRLDLVLALDIPIVDGSTYGDAFASPTDIGEDYEATEFVQAVASAIETIPNPYRDTFSAYCDGVDAKVIAASINRSHGTVRSRIHRARRLVREALA